MISIPITLVILMLVFGALVAAAIPLLLALTAVFATIGLVALPSQIVPMDESISAVILLVGLAVGVDYSLFYLKRERDERRAGRSETAALEAAAATSGRAVLISGITVMIAMAGMFFSGDKTFMSFAIGTMMVVAVAMLGSLTVLPAMLSWLGDRVDKGRIPFLSRLKRARRREPLLGRRPRPRPAPARSSRLSPRRPCSSRSRCPPLSLHTLSPASTRCRSRSTEVQSFNKMQDAFPGGADPALVAIKADAPIRGVQRGDRRPEAAGARDPARCSTRSRSTSAPNGTGRSASRSRSSATGTDAASRTPRSRRCATRSCRPRSARCRARLRGHRRHGGVAGLERRDEASAPLVFGFVLSFAFLLLLVSFRSIVIAVKAIVLNLLSVGAAYGVLVAVFQWGWGENLLDFQSNGGIASWLPIFMFVILFGLSMDYHVFILSRVREYFDRGMTTEDAVAHGIKLDRGRRHERRRRDGRSCSASSR